MSKFITHTIMAAAVLVGLGGCIPSKSEQEAQSAPAPAPAALNPEPPATPASAPETESDSSGKKSAAVSLGELSKQSLQEMSEPNADAKRIEEMTLNQGGVMLFSAADGNGYEVKGAYGLTGKMVPDELGISWKFTGKFVQKSEGMKVGTAELSGVNDGLPVDAQKLSPIAGMYLITLPVVLPDINAIETGDDYETPVEFLVEAENTAQFVISVMPVRSL